MKKVNALILTGFGLNCDEETAYAFELAGAASHKVHINELVSGKVNLADFQILALGGGFSWGDDHGAGVIQALKMKNHIGRDLLSFVDAGKLIIGICNGFQALINIGLLPGFDRDYTRRNVSITYNDCGNGEGKVIADQTVSDRLLAQNQVVFQYADVKGIPAKGAFPDNPNGSMADIAGICDPTGRIFGLMPHPEAYNHFTNHPDWPRKAESLKRRGKSLENEMTVGIRLFKNAVDYIETAGL
jgi:phosphoribosylformylglycinamidine synthase